MRYICTVCFNHAIIQLYHAPHALYAQTNRLTHANSAVERTAADYASEEHPPLPTAISGVRLPFPFLPALRSDRVAGTQAANTSLPARPPLSSVCLEPAAIGAGIQNVQS